MKLFRIHSIDAWLSICRRFDVWSSLSTSPMLYLNLLATEATLHAFLQHLNAEHNFDAYVQTLYLVGIGKLKQA